MNKLITLITLLTGSGMSLEDAHDRAIELGVMCCGAYCTEAGCCKFKPKDTNEDNK